MYHRCEICWKTGWVFFFTLGEPLARCVLLYGPCVFTELADNINVRPLHGFTRRHIGNFSYFYCHYSTFIQHKDSPCWLQMSDISWTQTCKRCFIVVGARRREEWSLLLKDKQTSIQFMFLKCKSAWNICLVYFMNLNCLICAVSVRQFSFYFIHYKSVDKPKSVFLEVGNCLSICSVILSSDDCFLLFTTPI